MAQFEEMVLGQDDAHISEQRLLAAEMRCDGMSEQEIANFFFCVTHPYLQKFINFCGGPDVWECMTPEEHDREFADFSSLVGGSCTINPGHPVAEQVWGCVQLIMKFPDEGYEWCEKGFAFQRDCVRAQLDHTNRGDVALFEAWEEEISMVDLPELCGHMRDLGVPVREEADKREVINIAQFVIDEALAVHEAGGTVPKVFEGGEEKDPFVLPGFGINTPVIVRHPDICYSNDHGCKIVDRVEPTSYYLCEKASHVGFLADSGLRVAIHQDNYSIANANYEGWRKFREFYLVDENVGKERGVFQTIPPKLCRMYWLIKSCPGKAYYLAKRNRTKFLRMLKSGRADHPDKKRGLNQKQAEEVLSFIKQKDKRVSLVVVEKKDKKGPLDSTDCTSLEGMLRGIYVEGLVTPTVVQERFGFPESSLTTYERIKGRGMSMLTKRFRTALGCVSIPVNRAIELTLPMVEQKCGKADVAEQCMLYTFAILYSNISYDPNTDMLKVK